MKDYKDTLLMMNTTFPMRGNLGVTEIPTQKEWNEKQIYQKALAKNAGKRAFHLHDGPPYANGKIHIGHAINKILKDFIIRYQTMSGFYAPYVPGWDTHGLPIETALTKDQKVNRKELSISEFRALCEKYAFKQIEIQKQGFKRLGILGEWEQPYVTLDKKYEATQIRAFAEMVKKGLVYKGLRPVYWSPSSETALAEAEIEYHDVKSFSIFVAFRVVDGKNLLSNNCELVIWTTTPWTIPANLAICVNPKMEYVVVDVDGRFLVIAKELCEKVMKELGYEQYEIVKSLWGDDLEGIQYQHPLYNRNSPVILGEHVTMESGTGLVHTAPGHGEDDFIVGKKYNLEILCPVDSRGYMTEEAGEFAGLFYEEANSKITERLKETGALLKKDIIVHSYPHDWRTGKPIIFRATPQWFASITPIKEDILNAIERVEWVPAWGEVRIANMIKDRDEWCISRQRAWGVPIPVFYAEDGTAILDDEVISHVANLFEQYGSNYWFEQPAEKLLPEGYKHPGSPNGKFTKETDIMDVWFDSGTSHQAVMKERLGAYPADVYLEGSDQYRGWFNSSITTGVALTNEAPFKTVITHGFSLDGEGRKMSKSLGNVIDPHDVMKEFGADILRLWAASIDYQSDFRISYDLLRQISEAYRKIRNTFRFLLGNTFDFDPEKDLVDYPNLPEIDQYMMCRLNQLIERVHQAYQRYSFEEVYRLILLYMTNDLSAFYLDFTKDVLYIELADSNARRSIQTVFYHNLGALTALLTPIIPHTTEEVYRYMPGLKKESVYLVDLPHATIYNNETELTTKYEQFMLLRDDVLKALENARNDKIIGKSLNAHLLINPTPKVGKLISSLRVNLAQVFIVSQLTITDEGLEGETFPSGIIKVELAQGETCSRCWQVVESINEEELCPRCQHIVANLK
ncbi:MAG: isoleucine--tRNA ligase [Bacilli bacterium]|jgi:isoleucyl-tRNA synthetase|nr:isoleucine--tRNA ligase [Bacilli bacterium]